MLELGHVQQVAELGPELAREQDGAKVLGGGRGEGETTDDERSELQRGVILYGVRT